jgi:DNA repair exonuclease SbcCD ATPase subunit
LQTIIEALRYATTGVAPPGTLAGKSFVYDPNLTNHGESLGQVKLRFKTTKKQVMQVKRSIKCTLKRDRKVEMKNMEPTLEFETKHGEVRKINLKFSAVF